MIKSSNITDIKQYNTNYQNDFIKYKLGNTNLSTLLILGKPTGKIPFYELANHRYNENGIFRIKRVDNNLYDIALNLTSELTKNNIQADDPNLNKYITLYLQGLKFPQQNIQQVLDSFKAFHKMKSSNT